MAEIAGGAVRSLLGVIRDEMYRLDRVEGDVQFIKEEMESMNSFLMHLARTTPPGREHDEQVRTWMKQVRDLAHDCNNSIDRYLRQGDPAIYRARSSMGYLWWVPWYLRKLAAQHLAASELHELKARARDVGERRLRYGVKVPAAKGKQEAGDMETTAPPAATIGATTQVTAAALGRGHTDEDTDTLPNGIAARRAPIAFAEPHLLEDCTKELVTWLKKESAEEDRFPSIAIIDTDLVDGGKVVRDALGDVSVLDKFKHKLWINVTGYNRPWEILKHISDMLILIPTEPEVLEGSEQLPVDRDVREKELDDHFFFEDIEHIIREELLQAGTERSRAAPLDDELSYQEKLEKCAKRILYMQWKLPGVGLDLPTYISILQQLPCEPKEGKVVAKGVTERPASKQLDGKLGEDQIEEKIKETMEKVIAKMLRQLLPQSDDVVADQLDHRVEEMIKVNIQGVLNNIKDQILTKEQIIQINNHLERKLTLIILEGATVSCLNNWNDISCALSQLDCAAGSAVIVTTKASEDAQKCCSPAPTIPINFSLVDFYYDKALEYVGEDLKSILYEILKKCDPSDFCMKMFVGALYAQPNRSKEELRKLSDDLSYAGSDEAKATKMIKFFYNELHRDYKACLLYLAIFPSGDHKISRSRLVARWVVEGLIASENWNKSVDRAKHCFHELANRWLVCPGEIGDAGKVKSCTLHNRVHDFVTKMAKEEKIRDTRLSHELARHFSIHSNIRLRTSEKIGDFLRNPSRASSQLQLLKVLDLEGCESLHKNQKDLKNVCNMVILLKFLSLRNTNISKLPKEINKLQQLEVLDIRQTCLGRNAIQHLVLTKLRHLLAGRTTDQNSTPSSEQSSPTMELHSTVRMPHKTGEMTGLQVLSHVQASRRSACRGLQQICELWQLRKLGVVINGDQLENLLKGISDLHECLESLSIVINKPGGAALPKTCLCLKYFKPGGAALQTSLCLKHFKPPTFLKSLKICGNKEPFQMPENLLEFFTKGNKALSKVTLHNTSLSKGDMNRLSDLDKLFSLRLRNIGVSELTFKANRFNTMRYLLVEGSNITKITFEDQTILNLEKIVVCSSGCESIHSLFFLKGESIDSVCDINGIFPELHHVEFNGAIIPRSSWKKEQIKNIN